MENAHNQLNEGTSATAYPKWIYLAILAALTCVFYFPSLQNGFVNWDDTMYVIENKHVQSLSADNIGAIFTTEIAENYHPLTMLSLALDYSVAGAQPFFYHLMNLLLHLVNAMLVFQFILLLTGRRQPNLAFLAALLFALHPMHVESVAWVTGRKDLLFTLFYLAGLMSYVFYLEKGKAKWLIGAFVLAAFSLLSKPSAVSFFLVLPLLDWWHGRKFTVKTALEKLPFAAAAIAIAIITINLQTDSSLKTFEQIPLLHRLNFASFGLVFYLVKCLLPFNLSPFHPYPDLAEMPIYYYYMPVLALGLVGGLFWLCKKWNWKEGTFGLLFFLVTMLPTLQLVSFGEAVVSERYTYLPYVGLFFLLADGLARLSERFSAHKNALLVTTTAWCALLAATCFQQTKTWKDGISLWTAAIEGGQFPTSKAYTNRGTAYAYANRFELALDDFARAKELNPSEFDAYHNSGIIYYRQNRLDEALEQLTRALEIIPLHPNALGNRGHVYFKKNDYDNAIRDYTGSINGDPYNAEVYNMRGFVLADRKQQSQQGIEDFSQALRLDPNYAAAYVNRSRAYLALNNAAKAREDVETAKKLGFTIDPAYLQEVQAKLVSQ